MSFAVSSPANSAATARPKSIPAVTPRAGASAGLPPACSRSRDAKPRRIARSGRCASHPARVIRAFAGDGHVVDVAFAQSGAGDAHELRLLLELGKAGGADIAHGGAQAAGELVQNGGDRALVGNLALDALGN